jgi:hypothetical protein
MYPMRITARRLAAFLLAFAAPALGGFPGLARAQLFAPPPPSLLIDTSIRSAAMGGAGAAVLWGEPGAWANPATLAGVNGVGWVTGTTHVLPGVEDDRVFSSQRLLIGGGGLGFSLMGQPLSGLGKAKLEYPPIPVPPFFTPGFQPYDLSEGWGVGGSPLRLIESVSKLAKHPRELTTYGDIVVGYQVKESKLQIDQTFALTEAETYDWGVAGKLALGRFWGSDAPFRLDLSGSFSQINVLRSGQGTGPTTTQFDRTGFALRLSPAAPSERSASPPSLPWWRPGDVPELSMGLAYDHDQRHDEPFGSETSGIDHYGFEANIFRLLALRVGYVSDPDFAIDDAPPSISAVRGVEGWTYGGGLTLPIGPWGSVGYQLASVPVLDAPGLDRPLRQGWALWIEPARIWSDLR